VQWHREKAGTIEGVHDVVKNELAGGVLPSKYFGANAAWLRLALPAELLAARPKRLRFLIFHTAGRLVHHARGLTLRVMTAAQAMALWLAALRRIPLPT
jgi:hypothetical protein